MARHQGLCVCFASRLTRIKPSVKKFNKKDKPEEGKTYALTGTKDDKCIANGYSWSDSEIK